MKRATAQARHVGFGAGFIDENEALRVEMALLECPLFTAFFHVGAILFAGPQSFF